MGKVIHNTTMFGVPCSNIKDKIRDATIPISTEKEAIAMAAGAWMAGKKPVVYMQNSGLGDILDPVMSLYHTYNIPLPYLILSIRRSPKHHEGMFRVTYELLDLMEWDKEKIEEHHEVEKK